MNPTKLNLSKYLRENIHTPITKGPLFEGIRNSDIEKALGVITSFLKKRKVYTIPTIECGTIDGNNGFTVICYTDNNTGGAFIWATGDTNTLESLVFTNNFDKVYSDMMAGEPARWDVQVVLKGASVVRSLQLFTDVMSGKISMDKGSLNKAIRDAQIWEALESEELEEILTEANVDAVIKDLKRKRDNLYQRLKNAEKKGKDTADLQKQYDDLKAELADARMAVKANVTMTLAKDPSQKQIEDRFEEEERALPEERFEDMESYIKNVILGIDVSALICGAPGVGKTYRIMQLIKGAGLRRGVDYEVIKGKCTPLVLYTTMHDFQNPRQLIICDDADDIIKDETSINLIKAATDSSDERIVSYGTSNAPIAPEEKLGLYSDFEQDGRGVWRYPKNFVYEGGMIIITNMNAGQIDTAIRSRAMICDLNFTTDEVLDLVRNLSPHIAPDILTPESKEKALTYLKDLADSGAPMEISIRSFTLVAKLYLSDAPEKSIQRRIREQMKLKFARGGKRY